MAETQGELRKRRAIESCASELRGIRLELKAFNERENKKAEREQETRDQVEEFRQRMFGPDNPTDPTPEEK